MTQSVDTTSAPAPEEGLPPPTERRRLREAAELSHEDVAAAMGVTVTTVRSWEAGRTHPRGRKRDAYARFLARLAEPPDGPSDGEDSDPAAAAGGTAADPGSAAHAEAPAADAEPAAPDPGEAEDTGAAGPAGAGGPTERAGPPAPALGTGTGTGTGDAPGESDGTGGGPAAETERAEAGAPTPAPDPAEAFDALYGRAAPALVRQTYLLTGRRALAREAVERAFHQAWANWPEVATDPDPVGWVRAAAYDHALSPWHQFRRAHRHPDKSPAEPVDRILLDAMLALPVAHRRTVLLYDGVGLDLPDTAAETEASTPTAGLRLLHAHADLADRIPELSDVAPEKQSALLRDLFTALRPAVRLDPRPAAVVRAGAERRNRLWTRAVVGLTAAIAVATAYTAATAPTRYEPPQAPGSNVSGVPPHSGPQRLTEQSRQLHDKLRADPAAGPARIVPKVE
uniref:Helix-turn-helix domain-containing protein n=1 Tax=Streptomyces sp. NBC_00049 TaxID=2903617 RepID=A0AAU2JV60_9ACTN